MKSKAVIFLFVMCLLFSACQRNVNNKNTESTANDALKSSEIKAVWINYGELDEIIKKSENSKELEENIKNTVLNCKTLGLNRIILHTRAFADAYYYSDIFPESEYLAKKIKSSRNFDPLRIFCEIAHENGLQIDAWINPYRISYSNDTSPFTENSVIKEMLSAKDGKDISVIDSGIFFNPSSEKVQKLILDGVREILENYDVDGIHIDDYFYPVTDESFDKPSYEAYKKGGGRLSLSDWRRENVNNMVSQLYAVVKSHNNGLMFSISPCGDIKKNYNDFYADVELWCSQQGYADCIIVQAYYGFEHEKLPFESVVKEWGKIVNSDYVKLCFGLACYKSGTEDKYAGSGINEWKENDGIILRQMSYLNSEENSFGVCFYSYSSLFSEKNSNIRVN